MLLNFIALRSILLPSRIFYSHFVHSVVILVYISRFGMLYQEKSGTPAFDPSISADVAGMDPESLLNP
jgi:hypothetical protein